MLQDNKDENKVDPIFLRALADGSGEITGEHKVNGKESYFPHFGHGNHFYQNLKSQRSDSQKSHPHQALTR